MDTILRIKGVSHRMYDVLLPVDLDTERALEAAATVSSLPNAAEAVRVTVLNVEKDVEIVDSEGRVRSEEWYDETDFPSSVEEATAYLEREGISVEARRTLADPAVAIVRTADEIDADQIVLCGRKRSPAGKVLFGSVTQSVLLDSAVPVTVVMK